MAHMTADLSRLDDTTPHGCLLGNGRYSVVLTGAGAGYSMWNGLALTPWSADRTEDGDGTFFYVRDLESQRFWSIGYQPALQRAERYEARNELGRVFIARADDGIETSQEVCVSAEADVEIRRLTLHNASKRPRRIEVTSYKPAA